MAIQIRKIWLCLLSQSGMYTKKHSHCTSVLVTYALTDKWSKKCSTILFLQCSQSYFGTNSRNEVHFCSCDLHEPFDSNQENWIQIQMSMLGTNLVFFLSSWYFKFIHFKRVFYFLFSTVQKAPFHRLRSNVKRPNLSSSIFNLNATNQCTYAKRK